MNSNLRITLFSAITLLLGACSTAENAEPATTEEFGQGLKFNSKDALEKLQEIDFDESRFDLPASFALDGPPIENQKQTSKCVAFSGAYYIIGLYNGVKSSAQNYDKAGSPEYAYAYWKKLNGDTNCDEGAYLFDEGNVGGMAEVLKTVGTTSWNTLPFVNGKTCSITSEAQKTLAASNKVSGYAKLDEDEYKDVGELKSWLYAGYPLWFAVNLDEGFDDIDTAVWNKQNGTSQGGHAMTVVGWSDAKKAFKVQNSWGTDFGDNGFVWIGYNYFIELLQEHDGTIGVLFPSESQKAVFNKLTPSSCGNNGWGELSIDNKLNKEVYITISGTSNYLNDDTSIDPANQEYYYGIPKGAIKVKVTDNKNVLIKEYPLTITQCQQATLVIQ
jgi:Papain family cysteine protease